MRSFVVIFFYDKFADSGIIFVVCDIDFTFKIVIAFITEKPFAIRKCFENNVLHVNNPFCPCNIWGG